MGALARSIATLILFPYIRAKVLVQAKKKKQQQGDLEKGKQEDEDEEEPEGIVGTLQKIVKEEGVLALYRGLAPELTKVQYEMIILEIDLFYELEI